MSLSKKTKINILVCCSTSDKDKDLCEALYKHMEDLRTQQEINDEWTNKNILGGDTTQIRQEKITNLVEKAEIILILVSVDFINYSFWEFKDIVAKQGGRNATVIAVMLRHYELGQDLFKNISIWTCNGDAIGSYKNWDKPCQYIVKKLRDLVQYKRLSKLEKHLEDKDSEIEVWKRLIKDRETTIKALKGDLQSKRDEIVRKNIEITTKKQSVEDLQELLRKSRQTSNEYWRNQIKKAKKRTKELFKQLEDRHKRKNKNLSDQLDFSIKQKNELSTELQELRNIEKSLKVQNERLKIEKQETRKYRQVDRAICVVLFLCLLFVLFTPDTDTNPSISQDPNQILTNTENLLEGAREDTSNKSINNTEVKAKNVAQEKPQTVPEYRDYLKLDTTFFNSFVNDFFCPKYPEISTDKNSDNSSCDIEIKPKAQNEKALKDKWKIMAMQMLDKLEKLSLNARKEMINKRDKKYFQAQDFRRELLKLHLSQKSIIDLTDAKFSYLFGEFFVSTWFDGLPKDSYAVRVWYAMAVDKFRELKNPSSGVLQNIRTVTKNPRFDKVIPETLGQGEGRVYIAYFDEGTNLDVEIRTNNKSLQVSIYDPKNNSLVRKDSSKHWQGKLRTKGHYQIVVVSYNTEQEVSYKLVVGADK